MSPQRQRRRRLAIIVSLPLLVGLGIGAAAMLAGSGGEDIRYVPHGGNATLVTTPAPRLHLVRQSPFSPAPAAIAATGRMALDAQVAQLFMITLPGRSIAGLGAGSVTAGGLKVAWGGVVLGRGNFSGPRQLSRLVRELDGRLRPPGGPAPLIAASQEGGAQTAFPGLPPRGEATVAASGDPAVEQREALLSGQTLRALGIEMTLAPLADVDVPSGALEGRLFGSDPAVVSRFTQAALRGYAAAGTIAAVGHFPGEGAASADPDQSPATVGGTVAALEARDLIPFAAVAAQAPVMLISNAAYAAFDGVTPASLLGASVSLLRGTLHFQGVVMSDDLGATLQPTGDGPGQVALQALQAGDDLLYTTGPASDQLAALAAVLSAARSSAAIRALVHEAVLRVLTLKAANGLL